MESSSILTSRNLAAAQGAFYFSTGLWPILSMRSFEAVTGPKTDRWLVKTVGAMIASLGGVLLKSAWPSKRDEGRVPEELIWVSALQAASLGGASLIFSVKGRISKIYLLDALAEAALIAAWTAVSRARSSERNGRFERRIAS